MKNRTSFHPKGLAVTALLCAIPLPNLAAQDSQNGTAVVETAEAAVENTLDSLCKAAESFVGAFNNRDAAAIAALFTPGAEVVGSAGESLTGRQAIQDYYGASFAGDVVPLIALEASEVQLITPGVAVEEGWVHLTLADDEPVQSISYTATHIKQADGSWLIASSHFRSPVTTPAEQIKPLHWLIGEWTLEGEDGLRIDMVIDLDDHENHLIGEALVTSAVENDQTMNLRIGWNPASSSVYWWIFDSEGGNSCGPWARRGDEWIVHTTGITADAEASASSQTLVRDGDTMVWSASNRLLAGASQPDLIYRFVRRAPDPLSMLTPEDAQKPGTTELPPATDHE